MKLTPAEAAFIVYRLAMHAKHTRKKLANAARKTVHPKLIEKLEADLTECTRLIASLNVSVEATQS